MPKSPVWAMRRLLHVIAKLGLALRSGSEMGFHKHVITVEVPLRSILRQRRGSRSLEAHLCLDIAHELGHYLVAPPGRRHRKDYGIPSYRGRSDASHRRWDLDEVKAVVVSHWLLAQLGFGKETGVLKQPLRTVTFGAACRLEVSHWWRTEGREQITKELQGKGIAIT